MSCPRTLSRLKTSVAILANCIFLSTASNAMTFEVVTMTGEPAILGHGDIVAGDAKRLRAVLNPAAKHSAGYFALVLSSPGGSVKAAFEVAKLMDKYPINTYVPPGAECISACAAIVFIAGQEHIVVQGGYLGFHGCYDSRTKKTLGFCNEEIANHAIEHGTAYGSVMAFIQHVPFDQIIWMDAEQSDCWAINRYKISPQPKNFEKCVFDSIRKLRKN